MRILHLLAPAAFGGLERVVEMLAAEQSGAGHDVHVAAILDPGVVDHPLFDALSTSGVRVHRVHAGGRQYRRERGLVRDLAGKIAPDVLHTHGYRTDVLHAPLARSLGIATVTTVHGFTGGDWKNRLYEFLQRRVYRQLDGVVAVSEPLRARLEQAGVPGERLHCIPNAWGSRTQFARRAEARERLGIDDDVWCAGLVGRLSHEKGPDIFVDAFLGVARALPRRAQAVVIGEGPMRLELSSRAAALGATALPIVFAGALRGAGSLIPAFDALVISSRTEGTPIVLLEAMAAGVPVVATRVGGIPHVVSEHEAVLVPPNDAPALAVAMLHVANDPGAALVRAQRAAARLAADFNAADWCRRYEAVYLSSASRRQAVVTGRA